MAAIVLTDVCNLSCPPCLRPRTGSRAEPWSFPELQECLQEIREVGHTFLGYTGGEPSLWSDGDVTFPELLAATSRLGFEAMFVTNGWPFRTYDTGAALLDAYFESADGPLLVVVSVDLWHKGSWVEGRSPALDALLQWRKAHEAARLEIEVSSLCCLDETRNLPTAAFSRYAEAGFDLGPPLVAMGPEMNDLAPRLCPTGTQKESLGAWGEVLRRRCGVSEQEWRDYSNSELVGPCAAGEMLDLELDRQYWLCNDRAGKQLRVATAGELTTEAIEACLDRNPLVRRFREVGVVEALRLCQRQGDLLPPSVAEEALRTPHAYGHAGRAACGICKSLPEEAFR